MKEGADWVAAASAIFSDESPVKALEKLYEVGSGEKQEEE